MGIKMAIQGIRTKLQVNDLHLKVPIRWKFFRSKLASQKSTFCMDRLHRVYKPRRVASRWLRPTARTGSGVIQINYPGTGNNSQFTFDPNGRNVKIVEVSGGTTISTKQFLWNGFGRCEERNGGGTITKQFFIRGETINGTSYFYSKDHLGSVCEMTDSIGNIQAQYAFDPYGTTSRLQASIPSDFQYAGYYFHPQSLLNLTLRRAYNTSFGRWISRDPIDEWVDTNLFGYVANAPVSSTDDLGLSAEPPVKGKQKPKAATECEEAKRKKCEECCRENFHYSLDEADWLLGQGFITQKHYDAKVAAATKAWDNCLQECIEDPDSCKPRGKFTPPGAPTAPTGGGNPPNGTP